MRTFAATVILLSSAGMAEAQQHPPSTQDPAPPRVAPADMRAVTPGLAVYTDAVLFGDVWRRAGLASRDRSLVTVAALIAGGNTAQMPGHLHRAFDNGLTPLEISELITHLAFYAGWPRAVSAIDVAKVVFAERGVRTETLLQAPGEMLPFDAAGDAPRAAAVERTVGPTAPALARYTNDVLFADLWRRPGLAPRDRSLATIAALVAGNQPDQLTFHIGRGMDNGLSRAEVSETLTHLAFYAGWPRAMSAVPVAKAVFETRIRPAAAQDPRQPPMAPRSSTLQVQRLGSQPPSSGPAEYFTGAVSVDQRFQRAAPARAGGALVTFSPGARTAWHTHPLGQTLIVTAGCGLVQPEGGSIEAMGPGDVVWIPPGVKHWHGATPEESLTHVAINEALDGKVVDWLEKVSDAQYGARSPAPLAAPGGC